MRKINDGFTKSQRWYRRHSEKAYEISRRWIKKHPKQVRELRKKYQRTVRGRYKGLKNKAKACNLDMSLTYETYVALISQPCFYCGGKLPEFGHGIDRIKSDVGYVQGNVRPCCRRCNQAKNDMTETEFREWSLRLFNHWSSR
jgi:5-methylcytosine-specific restriction endonuclease McrA